MPTMAEPGTASSPEKVRSTALEPGRQIRFPEFRQYRSGKHIFLDRDGFWKGAGFQLSPAQELVVDRLHRNFRKQRWTFHRFYYEVRNRGFLVFPPPAV